MILNSLSVCHHLSECAQNVSMVNTVLNTIVADSFRELSDMLEKERSSESASASALKCSREALKSSLNIVFSGNNYSEENQHLLQFDRKLHRIDSGS